jgi:hypothetical protein
LKAKHLLEAEDKITSYVADFASAKTYEDLVKAFKAPGVFLDVVAIVDGSGHAKGSFLEGGSGGVYIVKKPNAKPKLYKFYAGYSHCSAYESELRAVVEVLQICVKLQHAEYQNPINVGLLTDNYGVAKTLGLDDGVSNPANLWKAMSRNPRLGVWWSSVSYALRNPIKLYPRHFKRNSNELMSLADNMSRNARICMQELKNKE